jgi:hypothetical protein
MSGGGSGVPPINFFAHRIRAGEGAWADFEQMLALLVQAIEGHAHLVHSNPGDWGIDVLVGDMCGGVAIWQAKYYINGVKSEHQRDIEGSFDTAMRRADQMGYQVERWVLCVPASLDVKTTHWWPRWRAEHEGGGPRIELWDENQLRERLSRPVAEHIRRIYYDPYRPALEAELPGGHTAVLASPPDRRWCGGNEVLAGGASYLLHDDAVERSTGDHGWIWREATADRVEPEPARVWLQQVEVVRPRSGEAQAREALRLQADLLRSIKSGLPELVTCAEGRQSTTLVTHRPAGRTWREAFGPADSSPRLGPPDRVTGAGALVTAADVGAALDRLHRLGHTHRALDPDRILLAHRPRGIVLRDLGFAGWPPRTGEGRPSYRAPEQVRAAGGASPNPATDSYQLAALVYHTMTGHLPSPVATPPVRASVRDFPEALDELVRQALHPDPERRPAMSALVGALREGRRQLSRGDAR